MTITVIGETSFNGKSSGSGGAEEATEYSSTYSVSSDTLARPPEVLEHFRRTKSLPYFGRGFQGDKSVLCKELSVDVVKGSETPWYYTVTANFKNDSEDKQKQDKDGNLTDDPREWRDEIDISSTQISVPMERATYIGPTYGQHLTRNKYQAVTNSAGEVFDPLPEFEIDILVLRITKYSAGYDEQFVAPYRGTINSDDVQINKQDYNFKFSFPKFTGKIKQWGGTFGFENNIKYWRHTIELHVNPRGWRTEILDRGLWSVVEPDDPEYVAGGEAQNNKRVVDANGNPATTPVNFNGHGRPLPDGIDPIFLIYSPYREVPYANINW